MKFDELNLHPSLLRAIAERGYTDLTPVQEETLAQTLQGADVAVQSQTGTGKTAAFLITILQAFVRDDAPRRSRALIVAPTRELAVQIDGEAHLLNTHLGFTIGCFYGGVAYGPQESLLRKGVNVVIGTPGRLLDLAEKGHLKLREIDVLVIDEADRLFDMGFLPDIRRMMKELPPVGRRQSMLYSATLNKLSRAVAVKFMNGPVFISLTPEQLTVDTITQELYHVKSHIKANLLLGILERERPRNALIFTNMRHHAARLARILTLNGYRCRYLSGDLPQSQRLRIIDDFMAGKFPYLVATDVAARGLHIEGLEMVINYDLPEDNENYVHRIGRTARAGNVGKAVSFACEKFGGHLEPIESFIGMKIPAKPVSIDMFARDKSLEYEAQHPVRPGSHAGGRSRSGPRSGGGRNGRRRGRSGSSHSSHRSH
jgi:ATP-dependent RNA helicase RhlB